MNSRKREGQSHKMARGDGGGNGSSMSGRDFAGPRVGGPRFAESRVHGHEHGDRGRFAERHEHSDRDRAERHDRGDRFKHWRFAERDHDHDFDRFHHRHRVFRNGVSVWVYGPDYTYNDCWWLRRPALITGSPYWWRRYNYCVGYY